MVGRLVWTSWIIAVAASTLSCAQPAGGGQQEFASLPCDSMAGVLDKESVSYDPTTSSDEIHGSLKVTFTEPGAIHLFDIPSPYPHGYYTVTARLRSDKFKGNCGLVISLPKTNPSQNPPGHLMGTEDWITIQASTYTTERVDKVSLYLVADGPGTAWIDDIYVTVWVNWFRQEVPPPGMVGRSK